MLHLPFLPTDQTRHRMWENILSLQLTRDQCLHNSIRLLNVIDAVRARVDIIFKVHFQLAITKRKSETRIHWDVAFALTGRPKGRNLFEGCKSLYLIQYCEYNCHYLIWSNWQMHVCFAIVNRISTQEIQPCVREGGWIDKKGYNRYWEVSDRLEPCACAHACRSQRRMPSALWLPVFSFQRQRCSVNLELGWQLRRP